MVTDPIADLLTRIRNAMKRNQKQISIPGSKIIESVVKILKEEGFIEEYKLEEADKSIKDILIVLKYDKLGKPCIHNIKRISRPGLRIYHGYREIPMVLSGLGVNIFSTSKGVMSGKSAKEKHIGGEYLCKIW